MSSVDKAAPYQSVIRGEINAIKLKLEKVKAQLVLEKKTKERLRSEAISKLEQIAYLEETIKKEYRAHDNAKEAILEDMAEIRAKYETKLSDTWRQQKELSIELAGYDIMLIENEKLNIKLREQSQQSNALLQENAEQLKKRTQYNFDMTLQLDAILREFVTDVFSEENEQLARQSLVNEADRARTDADKYREMVAVGNKEGERLSIQERKLHARLVEARIEESIAQHTLRALQQKHAKVMLKSRKLPLQLDSPALQQRRPDVEFIQESRSPIIELRTASSGLMETEEYRLYRDTKVKEVQREVLEVMRRMCESAELY